MASFARHSLWFLSKRRARSKVCRRVRVVRSIDRAKVATLQRERGCKTNPCAGSALDHVDPAQAEEWGGGEQVAEISTKPASAALARWRASAARKYTVAGARRNTLVARSRWASEIVSPNILRRTRSFPTKLRCSRNSPWARMVRPIRETESRRVCGGLASAKLLDQRLRVGARKSRRRF